MMFSTGTSQDSNWVVIARSSELPEFVRGVAEAGKLPVSSVFVYHDRSRPMTYPALASVITAKRGPKTGDMSDCACVCLVPMQFFGELTGELTAPVVAKPDGALDIGGNAIRAHLLTVLWFLLETGIASQERYQEKLADFCAMVAQPAKEDGEFFKKVFAAATEARKTRTARQDKPSNG